MNQARLTPGFRVGHWTDRDAATGCTVVLPPAGNVASCDIRGSSPSSRELAHLDPDRKLTEIHAVVLAGGSAFGLAAADGVVEWLAERGIGYETKITPVPIVPAAVIFDLGAGRPDVRPGPEQGRAACEAATDVGIERGRVGAGTGATVGKWAGLEFSAPGGLGIGRAGWAENEVAAIAVVNSVGDVVDPGGRVVAGSGAPEPRVLFPPPADNDAPANTVLVVVTVAGGLDKREVRWLAARGSDGIAQSVRPAHTRYDGDVVFAIAAPPGAGAQPVNIDILGHLAPQAVAAAVVDAVSHP